MARKKKTSTTPPEKPKKMNKSAKRRLELEAKKVKRKEEIAKNAKKLATTKKAEKKVERKRKVMKRVTQVGEFFRPKKVIGTAASEDISPAKKPVGKFTRHSQEIAGKVGRIFRPFKWLFIIVGSLLLLAIILVVTVYMVWGQNLPDVRELKEANFAETTTIYDRNGNVLYRIYGDENRTYVPLENINQNVIDATISIEDKFFYHHWGFDPIGILRAQINNMQETSNLQGASTITQQLAKNLYLSSERSVDRKIKELILAIQIEWYYSKDEILEMYFNKIPYGSNAFGIEAAAKTFFDKPSSELNLVEASILAALPKATSKFSPYGSNRKGLMGYCKVDLCTAPDDPNYVWGRKDLALQRLMEDEKISFEQFLEAWEDGFEVEFQDLTHTITSPHFVFYVKDYLEDKYGTEMVASGGLEVVTTLDPDLQATAERVIAERYETNIKNYGASNAALVSLDPKTGGVLAMVGSLDYWDESIDGQVNITTSLRQPGSSFKPLVYANAIENSGMGSGTLIGDYKTTFPDKYRPNNSDNKFKGRMTVRKALASSRNIPAIKAWYIGGEEQPMLDFLEKVGIISLRKFKENYNSNPDRNWDFSYGPAMAIGSGEVKLIEMAGAFSTFANEGRFNPINPILEIRDRDGNVLESFEDKSEQAMMPETAYILNSILSDVYARPAGQWRNNLTIAGQNIAAKTGTSNKQIGRTNYPNNLLTLGYTPTILSITWVGNSDGSQMYLSAWGVFGAAPINKAFLEEALKDKEMIEFNKPEGIIESGREFYPPHWDKKKYYDSRFKPAVRVDCTDEQRARDPVLCKTKAQQEKADEAKKAAEEAAKPDIEPERPLNIPDAPEAPSETPLAPEHVLVIPPPESVNAPVAEPVLTPVDVVSPPSLPERPLVTSDSPAAYVPASMIPVEVPPAFSAYAPLGSNL
jgi:membrane peptidoglycan carboxypeptidase